MDSSDKATWYLCLFLTACIPLVMLGHVEYTNGELKGETFFTAFIQQKPSEIGDTLAGVFGSLAFLAAAAAIFLQSKELSAQREELQLTRGVLTEQSAATEGIVQATNRQAFDAFFFGLVQTHNSIVEAIDIRDGQSKSVLHSGRDCFPRFTSGLGKTSAEKFYPGEGTDETLAQYQTIYKKNRADLAHYFRFVHNSMRVIMESNEASVRHRRLFRAQFSDDELLLIFYNGKIELGKKMVPLIEHFALFNNLPKDRLIYPEHESWYQPAAYGE